MQLHHQTVRTDLHFLGLLFPHESGNLISREGVSRIIAARSMLNARSSVVDDSHESRSREWENHQQLVEDVCPVSMLQTRR